MLKCFTTLLSRSPIRFPSLSFIHYSHFVFGPNFTRFYKKIIRMMPINTALTCLICFVEGFGGLTAGSPELSNLLYSIRKACLCGIHCEASIKQTKVGTCSHNDAVSRRNAPNTFGKDVLCLVLQKPALPHLRFD